MANAEVERRLSAIMAADVVGYSRLIEADEPGTLAALRNLQRAVLDPLLAEHRGRIVKLMGDGLIAEFGSVVSAVACAAAVQKRLAFQQQNVPAHDRIVLRIGVNLGDVIVEGDDLLGDGVNVAARLEQICSPGSVLISGAAYDHLSGKLDCRFEDAGEQRLKNIARAIRTYRIVLDDAPLITPASSRLPDKPVIAVLPFGNMGEPDQVYFSDGITEDVITELSRFRELRVVARNSSFAFQGRSVDVREVGRALGAGYVVEGSVRRAGNRVRITAQLVEAATGTHLWADRYDRAIEDIFAVQEEIAQGIVATVAQRVLEDSEAAARRRLPGDIRAYDLFLRGHRLSDVFTGSAQEQARALFEKAREIDPSFARACTGLAYYYFNRAADRGVGVPRERDPDLTAALELAKEALALDPNDPRVQYTAGRMYLAWREFEPAERHFNLARDMNPNDPAIQIMWAWAQACLGCAERGLVSAELAERLHPRHPRWYDDLLARILFLLGRYEETARILEQKTSGAPEEHPRDMAWRTAACGHLGRDDEARRCAGWFIQAVRNCWRGDPAAGPREYVDWFVDASCLRRVESEELLRQGLRKAGLPA
jgi:adenylate cyclase